MKQIKKPETRINQHQKDKKSISLNSNVTAFLLIDSVGFSEKLGKVNKREVSHALDVAILHVYWDTETLIVHIWAPV